MPSSKLQYYLTVNRNNFAGPQKVQIRNRFIEITKCPMKLAEDILENVQWDLSRAVRFYNKDYLGNETHRQAHSPSSAVPNRRSNSPGLRAASPGASGHINNAILSNSFLTADGSISPTSDTSRHASAQVTTSSNRSADAHGPASHLLTNRTDQSRVTDDDHDQNPLSITRSRRQIVAEELPTVVISVHEQNSPARTEHRIPSYFNRMDPDVFIRNMEQQLRAPLIGLRIRLPCDRVTRKMEIDPMCSLKRIRDYLHVHLFLHEKRSMVFRRSNNKTITDDEENLPIRDLDLVDKLVKVRFS